MSLRGDGLDELDGAESDRDEREYQHGIERARNRRCPECGGYGEHEDLCPAFDPDEAGVHDE